MKFEPSQYSADMTFGDWDKIFLNDLVYTPGLQVCDQVAGSIPDDYCFFSCFRRLGRLFVCQACVFPSLRLRIFVLLRCFGREGGSWTFQYAQHTDVLPPAERGLSESAQRTARRAQLGKRAQRKETTRT